MNGSSDCIAFESAHLQHLVHNALSGHGSIAMYEHRQYFVVLLIAKQIRFGAGKSSYDRIDRFEMRGIGHQLQVNGIAVGRFHLTAKSHVVFHVAASHGLVELSGSFEFAEDLFVGFAHDVGQHVQSTAVGHANYHFLYV